MHARAGHLDGLGVEIDHQITGLDDRLRMALRSPYDRVNTRDQFVLVNGLVM